MYDAHPEVVAALTTILPTYYELFLDDECEVPCISYQENFNGVIEEGDTLVYSDVQFIVKVWANSVEEIQHYAAQVSEVMRQLGFDRTNSLELANPNSTMIQKVMTFAGMSWEKYE